MLINTPLLSISDRQDLYSVSYVRAIVAAAGFNFSKSELDRNSDDLFIEHLQHEDFVPAYPRLMLQIKCTYAHNVHPDNTIHYPLPVRNYNHLRLDRIEPRILVLVHVPRPEHQYEPWIECMDQHTVMRYRAYWKLLMGADPTENQDNVTIKVPVQNRFDIDSVRFLMDYLVTNGNKQL